MTLNMNIPQLVKNEIHKIDPDAKVILFGSRARGDYLPDSDWDFLILLDDQRSGRKNKNQLRDKLYELELETETVISIIIHSKSDWENRAVTPLFQIIEKEGIAA